MDDLLSHFGIQEVPAEHGQRFIRHLRELRRFYNLIRFDLRPGVSLSLRDTLRAWRYGFSRWSYFLYQLNHHEPRMYINDIVQFLKMDLINGMYRPACTHKVIFSRYIESLGAPCPSIHGVIVKGRIHLPHYVESEQTQWLFKRLDEYPPGVVLKPIIGCEGFGVTFLKRSGNSYDLNGRTATREDILAVLAKLDGYLITDFVVQHEYASALYARTTNTLRLLTLWDYEIGQPFLAASVQRIGTKRSYPVDNFKMGSGGLSAHIHAETGILECAVHRSEAGTLKHCDRHPETDNPIKGIQVPRWQETVDNILRFSAGMPYLPLIGWDVVMTPDNYQIIETNPSSGLFVIQATMPLLADSRVRRFFEFHKCMRAGS